MSRTPVLRALRSHLRAAIARRVLRLAVGEGDVPPDEARPGDSAFARRWMAARPEDLEVLLADDFDGSFAAQRLSRKQWIEAQHATYRLYPELTLELHETRVDPARPEVLWLRWSQRGVPLRGPVLEAEGWERLALDPSGRARSSLVRVERAG